MKQLPFLVCCVLLAYGLFRPTPPPELFEESDKVGHLLAFLALALTARLAFPRLPAALLWSSMLLLAPAMEGAQHWLQPTRQLSLMDAGANFAGVVLALLGWRLSAWWRRRQSHA